MKFAILGGIQKKMAMILLVIYSKVYRKEISCQDRAESFTYCAASSEFNQLSFSEREKTDHLGTCI